MVQLYVNKQYVKELNGSDISNNTIKTNNNRSGIIILYADRILGVGPGVTRRKTIKWQFIFCCPFVVMVLLYKLVANSQQLQASQQKSFEHPASWAPISWNVHVTTELQQYPVQVRTSSVFANVEEFAAAKTDVTVVFLHGAKFSSQIWVETGSLRRLNTSVHT